MRDSGVVSFMTGSPVPPFRSAGVGAGSIGFADWARTTRGFVGRRSAIALSKNCKPPILALAFIGWLADRRAAAQRSNVTPGLSLLPGDIKYECPKGNVRVYFPIVTSIVLSLVLSLILSLFTRFFRR